METKSSARVAFSCAQMYGLVCDIPSYKNFLKHCTDSRIITAAGEGEVVAWHWLSLWAVCDRADYIIEITLLLKL